jgi:hypothetical protein
MVDFGWESNVVGIVELRTCLHVVSDVSVTAER